MVVSISCISGVKRILRVHQHRHVVIGVVPPPNAHFDNDEFTRLIIEVEYPEDTVRQIEAALARRARPKGKLLPITSR